MLINTIIVVIALALACSLGPARAPLRRTAPRKNSKQGEAGALLTSFGEEYKGAPASPYLLFSPRRGGRARPPPLLLQEGAEGTVG